MSFTPRNKQSETPYAEQLSLEPLNSDLQKVAEKVVRKRKPRPEQQPQTEPGDNTKYLSHTLAMWDWPRLTFTDNDAIKERTKQYFELCAQDDMKPSVEGLAIAYGIDRRMLWKYANGVESAFIPDICRVTLKKAYAVINGMMANYMQNGKINPVAGIFLMKNNMGYTDQTEVVLTPNQPLGGTPDQKQLVEKYMEAIETTAEDQE